jgi:hypothetical protein
MQAMLTGEDTVACQTVMVEGRSPQPHVIPSYKCVAINRAVDRTLGHGVKFRC